MKIIKIFKTRKLFLLNLFLTLYVAINLIGGERGLISYFEKKNIENQLKKKEIEFSKKLKILENKNTLLSTNLNLDFLDTLYREKLKFGKKDEVLIKIK
jgi:cell division protein DivIC